MSKSTSPDVDEIEMAEGPRALATERELSILAKGADQADVSKEYYWVVRSRLKQRAERFAEEFGLIDAEHPEAAGIIRDAVYK